MTQNSITQRFILIYNDLNERRLVRSARQFALSLDFYPQSWNDILKGRRDVTIELIRMAVTVYNINAQYLFTGIGDMYLDSDLKSYVPNAQRIPIVTRDKLREYVKHEGSYSFDGPFINLSQLSAKDKSYIAFEIGSDLIDPHFVKGDILICRQICRDNWHNLLCDGFCYVIITRDDLVVDRIVNRIGENNTIFLRNSKSSMTQTNSLGCDEINEIWEMVWLLTNDLPQPNSVTYNTEKQISDFTHVLEKQCESISSLQVTINKLLKQNRVSSF